MTTIYIDASLAHASTERDCNACGEQFRYAYTPEAARDRLRDAAAKAQADLADVDQSDRDAWTEALLDAGVTDNEAMPDNLLYADVDGGNVSVSYYLDIWDEDGREVVTIEG